MAQEVLRTQDLSYCNRIEMTRMKKLWYNGRDMAFSPYNDHWRQVRKLCTLELFTQKRAQLSFHPVREDEVAQMIGRIAEAASASKHVNGFEYFSNYATSITSRVAFGKRYDEDTLGKEKFRRMVADIKTMLPAFFVSDLFPMFGWIDRLSGLWAILDRNFKEMDKFYQELIDEHSKPDRPKSSTEDLIDVMLKKKSSTLPVDSMKVILLGENVYVLVLEKSRTKVLYVFSLPKAKIELLEEKIVMLEEKVAKKKEKNREKKVKFGKYWKILKMSGFVTVVFIDVLVIKSQQKKNVNGGWLYVM
ncbi:hypothetical protein AgCh_040117 [Apium graveolens]